MTKRLTAKDRLRAKGGGPPKGNQNAAKDPSQKKPPLKAMTVRLSLPAYAILLARAKAHGKTPTGEAERILDEALQTE